MSMKTTALSCDLIIGRSWHQSLKTFGWFSRVLIVKT